LGGAQALFIDFLLRGDLQQADAEGVYVSQWRVLLIVCLRCDVLAAPPVERHVLVDIRGELDLPDAHLVGRRVDEDVVSGQVPVDNWEGLLRVEVVQAPEDLPASVEDDVEARLLDSLKVPASSRISKALTSSATKRRRSP